MDSTDEEATLGVGGERVGIADILTYLNESNIINVYALWRPINLTVTYDGNGATKGHLNNTTYNMDLLSIRVPAITNSPDIGDNDSDLYKNGSFIRKNKIKKFNIFDDNVNNFF